MRDTSELIERYGYELYWWVFYDTSTINQVHIHKT